MRPMAENNIVGFINSYLKKYSDVFEFSVKSLLGRGVWSRRSASGRSRKLSGTGSFVYDGDVSSQFLKAKKRGELSSRNKKRKGFRSQVESCQVRI